MGQISLQGRYNRHAAWILNGIVIRVAQKMGLHRDGELLGLSPFETEMRRRLWWQIIMVDAKYAMLSGLSHSLLPRSWDTKEPKNINDVDLYPSATESIVDREGPTEMILVMLTYKVAKFLVQSPGLEALLLMNELEALKGTDGEHNERIQEYRRIIQGLAAELDALLDQYCDPSAGALHAMAKQMRHHIIDKLLELVAPAGQHMDWHDEVNSHKDNAFRIAVNSVEHGVDQYKSAHHPGFVWFMRLHFQLDIFVYMVGQLCFRTSGSLVEKAWETIEDAYTYHSELFDTSQKSYSHLATFVLKAWKKREEVLRNRLGQVPETPAYIQALRNSMPQDDMKSEDSGSDLASLRPMDATGTDASFDQFVPYLDFNTLDFDMWGNMVPATGAGVQGMAAQAFPFGPGPQPEW